MATFRILTYVHAEGTGFQVSVTSLRTDDVEHSVPLTDVETGEASSREEAFQVRGKLLDRMMNKIRERGDSVLQIREIGD